LIDARNKETKMRCGINQVIVAIVVASLFGGCDSYEANEDQIIITNLDPPYADVPIPDNFTIINPAASGRYAEYLYQSTYKLKPVVNFFNEQLPPLGWVAQGKTQSAGQALLKYKKGNDMLQISISSADTTIHTNTSIRISPVANGAATQG
jgi:hypothetical protein